tara:strand:+ start:3949 stop:4506 length:558 start_codon:yes stop_codon:yes gene_type:complete
MKSKPVTPSALEDSAVAREISALIRELQPTLLEYTAGLLGGADGADGADDVVQETNLFLWEKRAEFEIGSDFRAWALKVAKFKVMAARRDRGRDRLVFSEEILSQIEAVAHDRVSGADRRMRALTQCLSRMRLQDRRLLEWKYVHHQSLTKLAEAAGLSSNAVHKKISRMRLALRQCIEKHSSKI